MAYLRSTLDIFTTERLPYIVGGGLVLLSVYAISKKQPNRKRSKIQVPPGTVLLYQFSRGPDCPSISPLPVKLETFLRMNNIPYETDLTTIMSSKGKIPWMTYNGVDVADSQFCIEHLKKELSLEPNSHLSDEQRGQAHAVRRMLEDGTYWNMVHQRWGREGPARDYVTSTFSVPRLILKLVIRSVRKALWYQGTGRHTNEEVDEMMEADLRALSQILGAKKFITGDEPCEEDCSVFGIVCQFRWATPGTNAEALLKGECSNLSAYCDRMKEKFWPDWDQCLAAQDK
jgi:glutathione S-transferase